MTLRLTPFDDRSVEAAAELLAARHRAFRASGATLSQAIEEPTAAADVLRHLLRRANAKGIAARDEDRLVAFLVGTQQGPAPESSGSVTVPYEGIAASQDHDGEIYRELYAAAAAPWVREGCLTHFVSVLATDLTALDAWYSLGFGQDTVTGVRNTGAVAGAEPEGIEIRRGELADVDAIVRLEDELRSYEAGSPVFLRYSPERRAGMSELHERLLLDPANAYWIASRSGRAVGYQLFAPVPPGFAHLPDGCVYLEQACTERNERKAGVGVALLRRGMEWARQAGYEYCATDWVASNLLAARFWPAAGFVPTSYRLRRRVEDQRGSIG